MSAMKRNLTYRKKIVDNVTINLNEFRRSYYDIYSSWILLFYRDKAYNFHLNFPKWQ